MMRNGISSRLGYLSFVLLLSTWAGAAEQGALAVAEVPVPEQPVEVSIKGLCTIRSETSKALGAEFERVVSRRKEPVSGAKMKLELVVSLGGFVKQVKVLDAADDELGQIALLVAGLLQCKATGRTVKTFYPVVFSEVDE